MTTVSMALPRVFATVGLGLAIAGAIGTLVVRYVFPVPFITVAFGFGGATMVGFLVQGLSWASIGALLVLRRPQNPVGWLMVLVGVGNTLSQLTVAMTFAFVAQDTYEGARLAQIAGWLTVAFQLAGIFQIWIGFVFPDGRMQAGRWAWFIALYWAFAVVFVVISLFQPGGLQLIPALQNPFGFGPDLRGDRPIAPLLVGFAVIVLGSLAVSMASRYRMAGRVERQQLKWFVLALGVSSVGLAFAIFESVVSDSPAIYIGLTVYVFAGALVPVAIGIAILRHHLYEIDRIISRTIGWTVVSGLLIAVFAGMMFALQAILARFTEGETLAVAASTLLALALFQPVRSRVQGAVDRRFDRARYDAERTAAVFAELLRDEIDLAAVTADLGRTTASALAPRSLGVWLRSDRTDG